MDNPADLRASLASTALAIAAQAGQLEDILQREREALVGSDDAELDRIARDKDVLVRALEALERERLQLARDLGISPGPAPMRLALHEHPQARDAWAVCLGVLERCQALNSANGRIVETKLRNVRMALELLSGRDLCPDPTYGPSGRPHAHRDRLSIARV